MHLVIVDGIKLADVLGFHKNFNFWKLNVSERNYVIFRKIGVLGLIKITSFPLTIFNDGNRIKFISTTI